MGLHFPSVCQAGRCGSHIVCSNCILFLYIQLLPSSYNQMRTVTLNYEVLANIYYARRNHKLDEWHVLCAAILELPYARRLLGAIGGETLEAGDGT